MPINRSSEKKANIKSSQMSNNRNQESSRDVEKFNQKQLSGEKGRSRLPQGLQSKSRNNEIEKGTSRSLDNSAIRWMDDSMVNAKLNQRTGSVESLDKNNTSPMLWRTDGSVHLGDKHYTKQQVDSAGFNEINWSDFNQIDQFKRELSNHASTKDISTQNQDTEPKPEDKPPATAKPVDNSAIVFPGTQSEVAPKPIIEPVSDNTQLTEQDTEPKPEDKPPATAKPINGELPIPGNIIDNESSESVKQNVNRDILRIRSETQRDPNDIEAIDINAFSDAVIAKGYAKNREEAIQLFFNNQQTYDTQFANYLGEVGDEEFIQKTVSEGYFSTEEQAYNYLINIGHTEHYVRDTFGIDERGTYTYQNDDFKYRYHPNNPDIKREVSDEPRKIYGSAQHREVFFNRVTRGDDVFTNALEQAGGREKPTTREQAEAVIEHNKELYDIPLFQYLELNGREKFIQDVYKANLLGNDINTIEQYISYLENTYRPIR